MSETTENDFRTTYLTRLVFCFIEANILQENMRWKGFSEIYLMDSFAPCAKFYFSLKIVEIFIASTEQGKVWLFTRRLLDLHARARRAALTQLCETRTQSRQEAPPFLVLVVLLTVTFPATRLEQLQCRIPARRHFFLKEKWAQRGGDTPVDAPRQARPVTSFLEKLKKSVRTRSTWCPGHSRETTKIEKFVCFFLVWWEKRTLVQRKRRIRDTGSREGGVVSRLFWNETKLKNKT